MEVISPANLVRMDSAIFSHSIVTMSGYLLLKVTSGTYLQVVAWLLWKYLSEGRLNKLTEVLLYL